MRTLQWKFKLVRRVKGVVGEGSARKNWIQDELVKIFNYLGIPIFRTMD